ncbi:heme-binding domain-containing protein [Chitinophaga sp. sic0106]|uniref:heme-binding domain-containing protein n=1 Tax=Chitinophaga sp. sic0106 TaxID=2854785 RepID=UPI001C43A714|nr:heme-binding domain-containing protein [Chitinophaga sp. sic0106]MBV7533086.1 heme-binding domain-containing protein [Chitinophaga sp. sic0106]
MKISNRLKIISVSAGIVLAVTAALSFTTKLVDNPPVTGDLEAPAAVKEIFSRACYPCHSNTANLKWFDKLPGVASIVRNDILTARKHLNFSEWDKLAPAAREAALWEAYNMINSGTMPLPSYAAVHSDASVSAAELTTLRNYLLTKKKTVTAVKQDSIAQPAATLPNPLPTSLTGIQFMPEFRQWEVMSTTSRFDNTTMRVMYANPIAMKAIREKQIHPWPDGAVIAKVVWDKERGNDGYIYPGNFQNVQFMVRNAERYKSTDGWGYAKFETKTLKPTTTLLVAQSCATCHKAAAKTGGIFDLSTLN